MHPRRRVTPVLRSIPFAVDTSAWSAPTDKPVPEEDDARHRPCAFCGVNSGAWQSLCAVLPDAAGNHGGPAPACPLCALPQNLQRPQIDQEADLAWLPEMSQQTVNALVREVHIRLRTVGESLEAAIPFRKRSDELRRLHYTRSVLAERVPAAASRLGTASPRELGAALLRLSPAGYGKRGMLLGGIRLLPLGRFFSGDEDVYPSIVDEWIQAAHGRIEPGPGARSSRLLRGEI